MTTRIWKRTCICCHLDIPEKEFYWYGYGDYPQPNCRKCSGHKPTEPCEGLEMDDSIIWAVLKGTVLVIPEEKCPLSNMSPWSVYSVHESRDQAQQFMENIETLPWVSPCDRFRIAEFDANSATMQALFQMGEDAQA